MTADAHVRTLADTYLAAYFERFPDQVTYYGVPNGHHDRLPDNALPQLRAWEDKEDAWLTELESIDPGTIDSSSLRATYAIVREAVAGSVQARSCRSELWNVSQMTGWHVGFGYLVTIQPVGSDEARREALQRWRLLPGYIDTEITNLQEGLRLHYSAPAGNVRIVMGQMDALLGPGESPFLSPASRDQDAAFGRAVRALHDDDIRPAIQRYRAFLERAP